MDPVAELAEVALRLQLGFPLLSDPEQVAIRAWNVRNPDEFGGIAIPATIGVDRAGIVRFSSVDRKVTRVRSEELLAFAVDRTTHGSPKRRAMLPTIPQLADAIRRWFRLLRRVRQR